MLLFIGGPEILIILLFVVLFFGANKIPELAKGLGKAMRELKDASNEIKKDIRDSTGKIKDHLDLEK
ncbi:MAG: twin-arginine translocase TatA/TatE family subunit [Flavobacteriales bacterium]|jgi:sec-independent protein translocase protein TatA|nr:twin-arginine translocase TatA/TatE family subunit [Flavobacteriales bacterium]MDP7430775.1 twin-arginine translocase TatA/TatE family subunit [Flavobacteriales bacterium]HJN63256.1 twin-arginine translocase TatA/TatE family subunit [Flavobacteriales bacterium]|tara:strand:- start:5327 stop:5527 length:201 start_codon:yes stop_codon:yes gene_type:complete